MGAWLVGWLVGGLVSGLVAVRVGGGRMGGWIVDRNECDRSGVCSSAALPMMRAPFIVPKDIKPTLCSYSYSYFPGTAHMGHSWLPKL